MGRGTGGALTKVNGAAECLRAVCTGAGKHLLPDPSATILVDAEYRFSALGTLAHAFPDDVRSTFRRWIDARMATARRDQEPVPCTSARPASRSTPTGSPRTPARVINLCHFHGVQVAAVTKVACATRRS